MSDAPIDLQQVFDSHLVHCEKADASFYPLPFHLASRLTKRLPRARAWSAKMIGRLFFQGRYFYITMPEGFYIAGVGELMDTLVNLHNKNGISPNNIIVKKCAELLRPGSVFFDVGANHGYVSLALAVHGVSANHRPGDGTRFFAFEPLPPLAKAMAQAVRLNGLDNVKVVNAALDREMATQSLFLPRFNIQASFMTRERRATRFDVQTFSLDALVEAGVLPPPDVMKIDVEGAEMRVLEGAVRTLQAHRPALLVECDENALRFGHDPVIFTKRLHELGYNKITFMSRPNGYEKLAEGVEPSWHGDYVALVD